MAEIQDETISDLSQDRLGNWLHGAVWDGPWNNLLREINTGRTEPELTSSPGSVVLRTLRVYFPVRKSRGLLEKGRCQFSNLGWGLRPSLSPRLPGHLDASKEFSIMNSRGSLVLQNSLLSVTQPVTNQQRASESQGNVC